MKVKLLTECILKTTKTMELPKNWVIDTVKEKDSPLMPKFMKWAFSINIYIRDYMPYIGIFNNRLDGWAGKVGQEEINLEQWNAHYFHEWIPQQGETILVKDAFRNWVERVFVVLHNSFYYCEGEIAKENLFGWNEAKPFPKESKLQPKIDELKQEAEKLGLKINVTFE